MKETEKYFHSNFNKGKFSRLEETKKFKSYSKQDYSTQVIEAEFSRNLYTNRV